MDNMMENTNYSCAKTYYSACAILIKELESGNILTNSTTVG